MVSVPFWDEAKARAIEPFVTTPARRVRTIERLARAGLRVGVMVAPIIPGLNDEDMGDVLRAARDAGATHAGSVLLRLPGPVKEVFEARLRAALPLRADKVLRRIRETRGGKMYDSRFGVRGTGEGVYAEAIAQLFEQTAQKLGFERRAVRTTDGAVHLPAALAAQEVSYPVLVGSATARARVAARARSGRQSGRRRSATPGRRRSARAPRRWRAAMPPAFAQPPTHGAGQPAHGRRRDGSARRRRAASTSQAPRSAHHGPCSG